MWDGVITNAGAALLAKWVTGGTLQLEEAWAGHGTVGTFEMLSQTGLLNPVQKLSMVGKNEIEGGIRLHLQHEAAEAEYTATQLGIFAKLDGGESTLIALYQDENGVNIPGKTDMPDFVYVFFASLLMDNTGDYTVNIDANALVSYAALEERLKSFEVTVDDSVTENGENAVTGAAVYAFVEAYVKEAVPEKVPASNVTAGTLGGQVQANAAAAAVPGTPQLRNIVMVTEDPGANAVVDYPDGTVIHVYE